MAARFVLRVAPLLSNLDHYIIADFQTKSQVECAVRCGNSGTCSSFLFNENASDDRCYSSKTRREYTGTWSVAYAGGTCQRWDAQYPHTHPITEIALPDATLAEAANYCRVPTGDTGFLWCYTTDSGLQWQTCDIHRCMAEANCRLYNRTLVSESDRPGYKYFTLENEAPCLHGPATYYLGTDTTVTKNGNTCQRWDVQYPQSNTYSAYHLFYDGDGSRSAASNYCRDPETGHPRPWCYTTTVGVRWEYCDIQQC